MVKRKCVRSKHIECEAQDPTGGVQGQRPGGGPRDEVPGSSWVLAVSSTLGRLCALNSNSAADIQNEFVFLKHTNGFSLWLEIHETKNCRPYLFFKSYKKILTSSQFFVKSPKSLIIAYVHVSFMCTGLLTNS